MRGLLHRIEQFKLYLSLILMMVVGVCDSGYFNGDGLYDTNYFFLTLFKNDDDRLTCSFDYFF